MKIFSTQYWIQKTAKCVVICVLLLSGFQVHADTETYDGAGSANEEILVNGNTPFDFNNFTYQINAVTGTLTSADIFYWTTYGNGGSAAIGIVGDAGTNVTDFRITKTDGSAFDVTSLWIKSWGGTNFTITGYNDGNPTGQSESVSSSQNGIVSLNFTGVDELRFEGTEVLIDIDDFVFTAAVSNNAPTASSFTASPIYEGTSHVFATSDFSYSDGDGDPLDHVRITAVPGNGTLYVDADNDDTYDGGEELANNDQVSKANLDAGNLQYLNSNGSSSSFTFEVNDGTDYSTTYTATLTVTPEPMVSFTSASQSSTDESGTMTITAQLSNAFNKTVSVPFNLGGQTSALGGGVDYSISSSPVSISAGSTSADITITIATDALDEPNEDIEIVMGTPTNATASGTTTHTATITDDDDAPTISFTTASQSSTDESGTMTITAQLSTASGKEVSVPFSIDALSTALGSSTDYSISVSPITIPASLTSAAITITITEDVLDEVNETVIINMGTPTNASATGTTTHTATITDDDDAPSVTTQAVTSIYTTTATGNGTITALGTSSPITQYGVCWNTGGSPTLSDSKTQEGSTSATGVFTSSLTSLSEGTTYYVRAYATSAAGTEYGGEVSFKTNTSPPISIDNTTLGYTENDAATQIDAAATVSDADGDAEWDGGKLEVQITANSEAADEISVVDSDGDGTAITISGINLFANGVDVADLSASGGVVTSGTKLTITFDADATNSIVQEVLQSIRYRNTSENPGTSNRTITFTATDKNSGSASDTRTVSVTAENDVPTISINSTLSLNEGATGTITSASHLSATDLDDNDSGLIFTITTNTTNGDVKQSGTILNLNDTFTQADLVAGIITYTHDGSSTTSDSFVFKVSDGSDALINQTFNITVSDVTAPLLLSSSPLDDATNATLSGNIVLNFDDDMVAGAGNITIKKTADNTTFEEIPIDDARISIASSQITINPAGTLVKGTGYYIEIDATALDDDGGNSFAGISGNSTLNFTTVDVVINEVVTDPQQDWSSTSFASAPGGTSGSNDEWVELYIKSDGIDLTGWTIELLDGSDITGDLTTAGAFAVSNYIGSGSFANTIVGDYLVLGNPAGAGLLNNSTTINLKDPGGAIVDAVVLGGGSGEAPNGASTDIYNESVQRYTNGLDTDLDANDFTQGQASIGAANTGASVTLSASSATVAEASGASTITASLSAVSSQDVTVTLAVNGSSSADAADYNLSSTSIVISAGNLSNTASLTATQDLKDENDETVIIDITGVTGGTETGAQQEIVTITDDDDAPSVSFTAASQASTYESGTMTITAQLSAVSGKDVTVPFTIDATSSATGGGTDYSVDSSPIAIPAGSTAANITITITTDVLDEDNETVVVNMGTPTNATASGTTSHTVTISDDDDAPSVSFTTASQSSTDESGMMTITAQLDAVSGRDVTVPFTIDATSSATGAGTDYSVDSSPITIPAGFTAANITITITTDALDEDNETVIVNMGIPTNATASGTSSHTATITDDDDVPSVSFTTASQSSTDESGTMTITAQLDAVSGRDVTVPFTIDGSSSAIGAGNDYTVDSSPIIIPAGSTAANITITITTDALDEDNETVVVKMGTPTNAAQGTTTTFTANIVDDDPVPTVAFNSTSSSGMESGNYTFMEIDLSTESGKDVLVDYIVTGTAEGNGKDHNLANGTLAIRAGKTSGKITIDNIVNDPIDEDNETIILTLSNPVNASLGTNKVHIYTILDNDDSPTVSFTTDSQVSSNESGTIQITAELSAISGRDVGVDFSVNETSTASGSGVDYSIESSPLNFAAGTTSADITITISMDMLDESDESVIVDMVNITNATQGAIQSHTVSIKDDDHTPVITANQTFDVDENKGNNAVVGTVLASDEDAGTSFSQWLIVGGNDDGIFAINTISGEISIADNTNLDFEQTESYTLSLTVSDGVNTSLAENVRIDINDLNDNTPVIASNQTFDVDENKDNNAVVGTVLVSDEDAGTSFSQWLIVSGNDDGIFAINTTSGEISIADNTNLDFEHTESYILSITVSDGFNTSLTENVRIDINDLNDNIPSIAANQTFHVDENKANNTIIGTVMATDNDAGTSFSAWKITAGNTDGIFELNASSGEISIADNTNLDYESTTSYTLSLTVSDGTNTSASETVSINVNPINDIAPIITCCQVFDVVENVDNDTRIGKVSASDADAGDDDFYTDWIIVAGNEDGIFKIDENSGEITILDNIYLDYERNGSHNLTLTVSDGLHTSAEESVFIQMYDENDNAPVITSGQSFNVDENASNSTSVGTVSATDADLNTHYTDWTITGGNTDGIFAINAASGKISITDNTNLDFEHTESYTLSITVSDGSNTSLAENVRIDINDLNDNIPVIVANQTFHVDENKANNTIIGTVMATDNDAGTSFSAWKITAGNTDGIFELNASSGEISIADNANLDFETTTNYALSITVSDGLNTSAVENVIININDLNDNIPVVTAGQNFGVDENSVNNSVVGIVLATDADAQTTFSEWAIVNGNEDGIFTIDAASGEISIADNSNLDFEKSESFTLLVTVSDGLNVSTAENLIISLNDINDVQPVITPAQVYHIAENSEQGVVVATIDATDGDVSPSNFTFAWSSNDGNNNSAFVLEPSTGKIKINNEGAIDREQFEKFELMFTVSDGVNTSVPEKVIVVLDDQNEFAPIISDGQSFDIKENSMQNTIVGTVNATDEDISSTLSNWKITSGNEDGIFSIGESNGIISIADNTKLDYEVITNYSLQLTVSDGEKISTAQNISIQVMNVNDNVPSITPNQSFTIHENLPNGHGFAVIGAVDKDHDAELTNWKIISGNELNAFRLNSEDGNLYVNNSSLLDREKVEFFEITVSTSDGEHTSEPELIKILLEDLNDNRPIIAANQSFSLDENPEENAIIGKILVSDADVSPTTYRNWMITNMLDFDNNGNNAIKIDQDNGNLLVNDPEDFDCETNASFTIKVKVSDGTDFGAEETITISLKDINEYAPVVTENQEFNIKEDASENTAIGVLSATDKDIETSLSQWTITDGNEADLFMIDPSSGEITLANNENLDFEASQVHILSVTVSDGMYSSEQQNVSINVIDVNEAPVAKVGDDQMVAGNVLVTLDGSNSTDPENDELTYHWTAPEGITLSDVNSAQPTFTSPILNQNKDFTFTLVVNDGEFDSEEVTTTINVELTTGVDDLNPIVEQVLLYPNPTKGAFNLSFDENPTDGALVIISNVNGQVFHQERIYEKVKRFNKSLAPGMYLVKIMYQNKVCTRKLLIQ